MTKMAMKLGATRCLRKPFRPTALLGEIDECLSQAEPHRRHLVTLASVTGASPGGLEEEALAG
jgi:DNA-binding response OmpR family regulator